MSDNDSKLVQTELSEDEYERFREFASEHGLSLKEAGHEAVTKWIERQQADPNDRAFTVLDELAASSLPDTADTDARDEDDLVDEEARRLYERYQSAETDEERHEMGELDGRRHVDIYAALEDE